ncbi:carbohydrate ABC transporter permease [Streptomyces sp. GMR22]|uniref:carbohydrate ABC transporter permease n=1 Tax=Streptomyces sp. GMR22 TaxID=2759524 RepID=UPI0015FDEFF2|nr:carbohydrate ABC transporter permease [Streptomyces sp. GMR22]MBA6436561.1 carbohydrate ABC transporter permease [Streptomyces sp. GMR22]
MEKPRKVTLAAKGAALAVIILLVLMPFLVVIATSLSSTESVVANGGWVVWPSDPSLQAYRQIFSGGIVTHALWVSIGVTVVGTAASMVCTVMLAYALARPKVLGGKPMLLLVLFTFLFPPGMIPTYLMVKNLGLLNNYAALIVPVLISVFNLVVLRGFFQSVPEELYEAARLDGAGTFRILVAVVLPLSKAALAMVSLFYAVTYWNSWFQASIYMNDDHWPLQQVLRTYVLSGGQIASSTGAGDAAMAAPQTIQMAVLVVATVPILLVYPFLQKYFAKGVLSGAIKS